MPDGAAVGLRVCWVTDDWDASYRYRCRHGVQQLRAAGVPANVYHLHDPALRAALPAYSVVVLFRLRWSDAVAAVVDAARAAGARLVFEIDDLIFDPSVEPLLHFLVDLPPAARREYHERFGRLRRTFDACDAFLGTTPALARLAAALGKPAHVHPNLLPPEYEATARRLLRLRPRHRTAITYGAGSNTHDRDLEAIGPALAEVLARRPERRLHLGGFVELPPALRPVAAQVVRIPYQDWRVYPWTLARCALAVAPVAVRNAFTDGKSALKFFEAGILGLPIVASPVEAFRDAITPAVDGFLAEGHDAWVDALERGLDPVEGDAVGRRARATVLHHHTFAAHAGRLAALLAPRAGRATGPEPPPLSLEPEERARAGRRRRTRRSGHGGRGASCAPGAGRAAGAAGRGRRRAGRVRGGRGGARDARRARPAVLRD
ncbi:MAG: glycosyltransferase [bacterium]|nr:glycosyltransferase [bacterium]